MTQHFIRHPFSFFESREVFEIFPLSLAKSSVRMRRHFPSALCLLYCFVLPPPPIKWHFCREAPPRVSSVWPCGLPRTWAAAGTWAVPGAPATSDRPGQGRAPALPPPVALPWGDLLTPVAAALGQHCEAGFSPWLGKGNGPGQPGLLHWGRPLPPQNLALPREEPLVFREAASCPGPSKFWAGAPSVPTAWLGCHCIWQAVSRVMAVP